MHGLWEGLVTAGEGTCVCAAVPLLMFRLGGMGGGDVKLLAGLGALCGPTHGLQIQWNAYVALLLFLPALWTYQGRLARTLFEYARYLTNPLRSREKRSPVPAALKEAVRFGPMAFAGSVVMALDAAFTI
jgi:Flp pilus assembly protein protease CpaA